jgi:hypothetical protein
MWGPIRALVWEQARVTGVLAVGIFISGMVAQAPVLVGGRYGWIDDSSSYHVPTICTLLAMAGAMLVFLLRQDVRGHLVLRYERRLARLPIDTLPLVVIPFIARIGALVLLGVAFWACRSLFSEREWKEAAYLIAPVSMFAILQALAWSRHSITGASWFLIAGLFVLPSLLVASGTVDFSLGAFYQGLLGMLTHPAVALAAVVAGFGYAYVGVHGYRRDERYGIATPAEVWERLTTGGRSRDRRFETLLEAQVWYEWKRMGWMLPGGTLLLSLVFGLLAAAVGIDETNRGLIVQYIPYGALLLSAVGTSLLAGTGIAKSRGSTAPYPMLRPATSAHLAQARMLVAGRSLVKAALIAFVLSNAAWWIAGRAEWRFFLEAYGLGHATLAQVLSLMLAPLLLVSAAAWVLLWVSSRAMLLIVAFSITMAVASILIVELWSNDTVIAAGLIGVQCVGLPVLATLAAGRMPHGGSRIPPGRIGLMLAAPVSLYILAVVVYDAWIPSNSAMLSMQIFMTAITVFFALGNRVVPEGHVNRKGFGSLVGFVIVGTIFCWCAATLRTDLILLQGGALLLLLVLPVLSLPLQIQRRRTQ